MVASAELGALALEFAGLVDAHPHGLDAAWDGVELVEELGGVEGVEDVAAGDVEADHGSDGDGDDRGVVGGLEASFGDGVGAVEDAHHVSAAAVADRDGAVDGALDGDDIALAGGDAHVLDAELEGHEGLDE